MFLILHGFGIFVHVCIYCINPILHISVANHKKKGKRALELVNLQANLQNSSDLTDVVTKDNVSRATMHDFICIIELYLILLLHSFDGLEQGRCQCKERLTYDLSIFICFSSYVYKHLVLESFILAYPPCEYCHDGRNLCPG